MIDVSGIEYDFLPSVLWVVGIVFIGLALVALGVVFEDEWWSATSGVIGILAAVGGTFFGGAFGIGWQADEAVRGEETRIATEQLTEHGFDRLKLDWDNKEFTASVEGEFFEGVLHAQGKHTYQILEVTKVEGN